MTSKERKQLETEKARLMQEYEHLEALQTQRSDKPECVRCLERKMQALDEKADEIRWLLEGGG